MVVIYAEKPDMGIKIAAALDGIYLASGKKVTFTDLGKGTYDREIKAEQKKGYFDIRFHGEPCKVTWGRGHVCGLKQAQDYNADYRLWNNLPVPFIPESYEVKPIIGDYNPGGDKARIALVRKLFQEADWIINATDFDREGEVIFAYLYEYLHCRKPYKRAHFTSQTQEGIQEGFKNLKASSDVKKIELAGRARAIADFIVGSNLTAQMTLKFAQGKELWSVGRVQSVALNLVVTREKEINNFKSTPFWTIQGLFTTEKNETYKGIHEEKRFAEKEKAEAVLERIKECNGVVAQVETSREKRSVPLLYSLSALQMDANGLYGLTAAETLDAAQWLYDNGFTTYPRSKSQYLNDDMRPVVTKLLKGLEKDADFKPYIIGKRFEYENRFFNSKKVDSHFAIIPTGNLPVKLNDNQRKVFNLICWSVIRLLYPPAILDKTTVNTQVNGEKFHSIGTVVVDKGWLAVGDIKVKEEILPALHRGEKVDGQYSIEEGKTKPPQRYNDKSLILAMKTAGKSLSDKELKRILEDPKVEGIGTEATRAGIIETLITRRYIERKGKVFYATGKGIFLIEHLPVEEMKSAETTALWEKRLSGIESGEEDYSAFIRDMESATRTWSLQIKGLHEKRREGNSLESNKTGFQCPLCKKGEIVKLSWGWGCSEYNNGDGCRFSCSNKWLGKTISDSAFKDLMEKGETKKISGFKSKKTGKKFDAKLKLEGTEIKFSFD